MKAVGERLRKARQLRGLTQRRVAREIGTTGSHLSSMEHGRVGTSSRTAKIAARIQDGRTVRDPEAGWLLVSDNQDKTTWVTRPWPEDAENRRRDQVGGAVAAVRRTRRPG